MIKLLVSKFRYLSLVALGGIIGLLIISYLHAYQFTHFSDSAAARTDPKNLTVADKLGLIFTGIQNPRQVDTLLPEANFKVFLIEGDKTLESWYIPSPQSKGLILLYHGYAGNKSQMISRADDLHDMGYSTAIIGFRGSGNSEGDYTTIGYEESSDVVVSYHFYREKLSNQSIFLFGTSMGAAAVLKALSEADLAVAGVILEYPFGTLYQSVKNRFAVMGFPSFPIAELLTFFGGVQLNFNAFAHDPAEYAKQVSCPTLYLAGDHDDRVTNEETMTIYQNLAAEDKTLHIFEGGGHESLNENFPAAWKRVCASFLIRAKENDVGSDRQKPDSRMLQTKL